jgi:hypothetical protein
VPAARVRVSTLHADTSVLRVEVFVCRTERVEARTSSNSRCSRYLCVTSRPRFSIIVPEEDAVSRSNEPPSAWRSPCSSCAP